MSEEETRKAYYVIESFGDLCYGPIYAQRPLDHEYRLTDEEAMALAAHLRSQPLRQYSLVRVCDKLEFNIPEILAAHKVKIEADAKRKAAYNARKAERAAKLKKEKLEAEVAKAKELLKKQGQL
jgi:hypothetical protein